MLASASTLPKVQLNCYLYCLANNDACTASMDSECLGWLPLAIDGTSLVLRKVNGRWSVVYCQLLTFRSNPSILAGVKPANTKTNLVDSVLNWVTMK